MNEERALRLLIQEMRGQGWIVRRIDSEYANSFFRASASLEQLVHCAQDSRYPVIYWTNGQEARQCWYISWGGGKELIQEFRSSCKAFTDDTEAAIEAVFNNQEEDWI